MTQSRRIFLNVVATYGRSLYALVIGLFTTRWVLMALGKVDFGLYGLVGGLMLFVVFLNGLMSMSVSRFYAVSVGAAMKSGGADDDLENCRRWFNTALLLHTVVPIALVLIGYPIGEWAVRHYLTIPVNRVAACVWVWRFACLAGLVSMMNVPFQAMYTAKQEIAELTIYSFCTTTLSAFFLYYIASHQGDWLVRYSLWTCTMSVAPQGIIAVRAVLKYPECRLRMVYLWNRSRIFDIMKFALARFWTAFSDMVLSQGQSILVNKYLGPTFNASMRVGISVSSQAATLSSSLMQAFWPAIGNAAGAGDEELVRRMTYRACRFGALLLMIFALPLALESHEVLILWLKTPPEFSDVLCSVILCCMIIGDMTDGYWMAVMSVGRGVARYSWWVGWSGISGFFVTLVCFMCNLGMASICIAFIVCKFITLASRLHLGRKLVALSPVHWARHVGGPIFTAALLVGGAGFVVRFFLEESLMRVVATTIVCETVLFAVSWLFVLDATERALIVAQVGKLRARIGI